jgi:hypothetical protein
MLFRKTLTYSFGNFSAKIKEKKNLQICQIKQKKKIHTTC